MPSAIEVDLGGGRGGGVEILNYFCDFENVYKFENLSENLKIFENLKNLKF